MFKDNMINFSAALIPLPEKNKIADESAYLSNDVVETDATLLIVNAKMKSLEICLRSAKDDMPLFIMTMAKSEVELHLSHGFEENLCCSFVVGDLRLEISGGKTLNAYTSMLGLAPSHSKSLLRAEYGNGPAAMRACSLEGVNVDKTEGFLDVELSPMRFVYVQAQILTLCEYVTEGVLGTMTARVASSAAQAAIDLARAEAALEKIFIIKAFGFDLVLPQAVYSENHFVLHAGDLLVRYRLFPRPGEAEAAFTLENVTMECNRGEPIIDTPIRVVIGVSQAPLIASTEHERAMKADVSISRASFLVTSHQYAQIMQTLEFNIGEEDSFLRDESMSLIRKEVERVDRVKEVENNVTHGGQKTVMENKKRIYMRFKIQALALELCGDSINDPIISLTAVETLIILKLLPDTNTTYAQVKMQNLFCQDKRLVAIKRRFKNLVSQVSDQGEDSYGRDVFELCYTKYNLDGSMDVDLVMGNPQVIIIPDALVETLNFFSKASKLVTSDSSNKYKKNNDSVQGELDTSILVDEQSAELNAAKNLIRSKIINISLKTADCRLVLIEMDCAPKNINSSQKSTQLSEAFVMQGKVMANVKLVSNIDTARLISTDLNLHGERVETYFAEGEEMLTPVQMMEPAKFSIIVKLLCLPNDEQSIDLSIVTLSNIDVVLSMQNILLLNTILSSIKASLHNNNANDEIVLRDLSEKETDEIEKLARALDNDNTENDSGTEGDLSLQGGYESGTEKYQANDLSQNHKLSLKITLPEAAITVVNDLQGLDEALFKLIVRSCVLGIDYSLIGNGISNTNDNKKTNFFIQMNTCILADYFDSVTNLWEPFLVKSWEINFKATRGKSQQKNSSRFATTIDIDSYPCDVSFSEQFLISVGSASSVWSIYSGATKKAVELGIASLEDRNLDKSKTHDQIAKRISVMKSMASNTARSLVTTMPYGVENHSGLRVEFVVKTLDSKNHFVCNSGSTEYFRFEPPKRHGLGGWRSYGQDVTLNKSMTLVIGNNKIQFNHLDNEVNMPKKAHSLGFGQYIYSEVVKKNKATVRVLYLGLC